MDPVPQKPSSLAYFQPEYPTQEDKREESTQGLQQLTVADVRITHLWCWLLEEAAGRTKQLSMLQQCRLRSGLEAVLFTVKTKQQQPRSPAKRPHHVGC